MADYNTFQLEQSLSHRTRKASAGHGLSWVDVSWLMLSDVVGTSVLTFVGVSASLGWALAAAFIVGLFPISLYVSVLMTRTRRLLIDTAKLVNSEAPAPRLDTMGAVAFCACRSRLARNVVLFLVYGFTLLGNASYLLVLGTSLQNTFHETHMCLPLAAAITCGLLVIPIFVVRRLGDSVILCFVNMALVAVVIVVALTDLSRHIPADAHRKAFASDLSMFTLFGAMTNVVYAFTGQWMYFEIMDTMSVPDDFPRAFLISGPFMVISYLVVALLGYFWTASGTGNLIDYMTPGPALSVAAGLLLLHVLVVYLIKSIVLTRCFHELLFPAQVDARTGAAFFQHGVLGCSMLIFGYVVANSVPFFSQLLGLIGGLLAGPINFLIPIVLYLIAVGRHSMTKNRLDVDGGDANCFRLFLSAFRCIPVAETVFLILIFSLVALLMVFGVSEQVKEIIHMEAIFGAPFSCHALHSTQTSSPPSVESSKFAKVFHGAPQLQGG